ncbi:MAG: hypothetical protein Kow0077_01230 [Anaerolineae bacterium]
MQRGFQHTALAGKITWSRLVVRLLVTLIVVQIVANLFWFTRTAHSGQLAIPWMMNNGLVLFEQILEQHAPGSSVLAALAQRVVPLPPVLVLRIAHTLLVVATTVVIFFVGSRLSNPSGGLLGAGFWFVSEPVFAVIFFYFDALLGLFLLLSLAAWLFLRDTGRDSVAAFLAGFLLGGATVMKQHAWAAVFLMGGWLLLTHTRGKRLQAFAWYGLGVLVLPAAVLAVVAMQGNLENYIYWNWTFNLSGRMDAVMPDGEFFSKFLLFNAFVPAFVLMAWREHTRDRIPVALMWLAGGLTLVPRVELVHVSGLLPALAVMTGVALSELVDIDALRQLVRSATSNPVGAGLTLTVAAGWLVFGLAPYTRNPLGPGHSLGYDEYQPVSEQLQMLGDSGSTLFVLPETDKTPQIHPQSGMLPSTTWIKGWRWYLTVPGMVDRLISEWQQQPPDFVVVFPDIIGAGMPEIGQLVDFVEAHYSEVAQVDRVLNHGRAVIYQFSDNE